MIVTSLPTPTAGKLAVGASVGGKGAVLGIGAEVGAEVGVEVGAEVDADDIAVTSIRFKLAAELNIYLELTEKVYILLRI